MNIELFVSHWMLYELSIMIREIIHSARVTS